MGMGNLAKMAQQMQADMARAETELQVRVRVTPSQALLPPDEDFAADEEWSLFIEDDEQAQQEYDQQQ